jgi:hypothetical protein
MIFIEFLKQILCLHIDASTFLYRQDLKAEKAKIIVIFFYLKRVLDRGPEHRESKMTVLCPLIIIILIS